MEVRERERWWSESREEAEGQVISTMFLIIKTGGLILKSGS